MNAVKDIVRGFREDFRESLKWASVRVSAAWGFVWFIYSQLPTDVMAQLSKTEVKVWIITFTVPGIMGLAQAATTYLARMKKPEEV